MGNYLQRLILILTIFFLSFEIFAQELIQYSAEIPSAKLHYNKFLSGVYNDYYKKLPDYPVKGTYSPTHYSLPGVKTGTGVCSYIYIPIKNVLEPGKQYHLNLTIKVTKDYEQMPYFIDHLGFALSSDLFENHFGLWGKQFIPFGQLSAEIPVTLDFEFRPLCTSKYLLIGVFQGPKMDNRCCFGCQYHFELHSLTVEKSKNPEAKFYYICDGFKEKKLDKWNYSNPDTIFFESGSAIVKDKYFSLLDSLKSKLKTVQDLVYLLGYTDNKGSENEALGAARNLSVRNEIIKRGIDSSRIVMVNYGETYASKTISHKDRKVEITTILGKLYQKYYTEALQAVGVQDYSNANKAIKNWLRTVPPDNAIYAIFDCWGNGNKADYFKKDLFNSIRKKFYKGKNFQFTLDSLYCESKKGYEIHDILFINRLPSYNEYCNNDEVSLNTLKLRQKADEIYLKHGFPTVEEVGKLGNITLPHLILVSDDLEYFQKYLPLVKKACENEQIEWEYFAKLYDKISIKLTGFQRYGTHIILNKKGTLSFSSPLEDISQLAEYRKQVKLAPIPQDIKSETEEIQKNLDKTLVTVLNTVLQSDQKLRNQTREIENEFGLDSDTLKSHWRQIKEIDSLNLITVKEILDQRGWLGPKIVGHEGNNTLFLVIQHADLETQLKYLPMIQKAVKSGNANGSDLAMLEDRVAIRQGKKQIYGTQIERDSKTGEYIVSPLIEPEKVNERRKKIGLVPIEEYVKRWGIIWSVEDYKTKK